MGDVRLERLIPPTTSWTWRESDVAVAVRALQDRPEQLHTGVVFWHEDQAWLLHLGWHYVLHLEPLRPCYTLALLWYNPPTPLLRARARAVRHVCLLIHRRYMHGGLPYSFDEGSRFSGSGELITREEVPGFTCATFVLEIMRAARYPILSGDWPPPDDEDLTWQRYIAHHLSRSDPEQGAALNKRLGHAARYRPEQVACAAAHATHPAQFTDIEAEARCLRCMLQALLQDRGSVETDTNTAPIVEEASQDNLTIYRSPDS